MGSLTVLDGNPGLGKSTLMLDICARVTQGIEMPDGSQTHRGSVVMVSAEDSTSQTILPRALAAGADTFSVYVNKGLGQVSSAVPICLPDDIGLIEEIVTESGAPLVCIDPLFAFLSGTIHTNNDHDVRRGLFPLAEMAARLNVAVVMVRHLNKRTDVGSIFRGGGSIGIVGAVRSGLLVGLDPEDENCLVLASVKCNLAKKPDSWRFRIVAADNGVGKVEWLGRTSLLADDLVVGRNAQRGALDVATDFLLELLGNGPVAQNDVAAAAGQQGISKATLRRAKDELGVKSKKLDYGGGWAWYLPDRE
jgi:hypothetical protein